MSHTLPDYTTRYKMTTVFGNIDDAELAARLGSINSFDRRGNITFMEDFSNNLERWIPTGGGVGHAQVISAERWHTGGSSCKLTTGDVVGRWAQIRHLSPFPVLGKTGFETAFTIHEDANLQAFYNMIYDGAKSHYGQFQFYPGTMDLKYKDSVGNYQSLEAGLNLSVDSRTFHNFKFVIDLEKHEYVRAMLDSYKWDMSGIAYQRQDSVSNIRTETFLYIKTGVAANIDMYVDDVILTQNEP